MEPGKSETACFETGSLETAQSREGGGGGWGFRKIRGAASAFMDRIRKYKKLCQLSTASMQIETASPRLP